MSDSGSSSVKKGTVQANAPPGNQNADQSFFEKYKGTIIQMVVMWVLMQVFFGRNQTSTSPADAPATTPDKPHSRPVDTDYFPILPPGVYHNPYPVDIPTNDLPSAVVPLWQEGTPMKLSVYVNESPFFVEYSSQPAWVSDQIHFGEPFERSEYHMDIPATQFLQNNGTLYAHVFLVREESSIDPADATFVPDSVVYIRHTLTKYYPKKAVLKQKNLLQKSDEEEEIVQEEIFEEDKEGGSALGGFGDSFLGNWTRRAPLVAYWHENITLSLVNDPKSTIPRNGLQPATIKYVPFDTGLTRDPSRNVGFYRPIVFPNDFWVLRQNAYPINETISTLPLTIHFEPIAMWKFNIYAVFDDSMKQQANNPLGGMSSSETDEVKRMFMETNPVLLGTTLVVSLLHSLFEFLAFKNDIAFWNKKKNSAGVSVRSIIVNIFFQIVIFLYLLDNNQETSWMVLIGQGFGLLIEVWKVFKALKYELVWVPGSLLPRLGTQTIESTETEDDTAKYDAIAFKYLIWLSYPLLGGYAIYSLMYDEHKSWYSFVLKTLVEFVYMFGFITMVPQLYINYRLKSVAHMPWRTLLYKSLNTFIDDLFAFVIKMPTLHRLACLRDDVVFFVYLYQRYAYKEDHTRANEFGQVGADGTDGTAAITEGDKDGETKKTK
ncbi:cleft lip and palate transmembrane protein 1-domain-containing protein [Phycomyces nitens]|nr:cleft lip and palate transmembrane protein 1-domain-containing protein [Phycomyces nitens]